MVFSKSSTPILGVIYKVCLNVVAISGIGTHVSCFIYLMRGDFDNHLTWPFRGEFTVQLLNQRENSNHHTTTFSFNDSTPNKVAGRVVGIEKKSFPENHFPINFKTCPIPY